MKTKITLLLVLLLVVIFLNTTNATVFTVQVANFSFSPNILNIHSGDTVKWVWVSGSHTTTSTSVPSGAATWDNPMNSTNTQFELKFIVVGTYDYNCSMHPTTMTGTITVAPALGLTNINNDSYSIKTYPNPFSYNLSISFTIPENGATKISIYDITGKLVKVLADINYEKGNHVINWDGKNENGETVNHGLYFYMIENKGLSIVSGKIVYGT
jgi:plastocyanin